jgi:hypothetical protein
MPRWAHTWTTILLCNWLIVVTAPGLPQLYFKGNFQDQQGCEDTRKEWQAKETRAGATWSCLNSAEYALVATPLTEVPAALQQKR